jgi:hypothetical protein
MLICNYSYINQICGHNHSGITNPVWIVAPHTMRGYFSKAQVDSNIEQIKRDSFSTGTNPPYSYILGDKGALLSSTTTIEGVGTVVSGLSMGINVTSALTGSGTISNANLSLVTALASALSGSGTITVANLVGVVSLQSSLSGTGSLTAGLSLLSNMEAILSGTSSVTASLRGTLSMEAAIYVNQSQATIDELVAGVWNALAASYNQTGSMGEIMNNMGSVADPWTTVLPGTYTGDQAGAIVDRLETLIKQVKALTAAQL